MSKFNSVSTSSERKFDADFKSPAVFGDVIPLPGGPRKIQSLGRSHVLSMTRLGSKSVSNSFLSALMTAAGAVTAAANTVKSAFEHRDAAKKRSRTLNAEAMKRLVDGIPVKVRQFSAIYESMAVDGGSVTFNALRPLLESMGMYLGTLEDRGIDNKQTEELVNLKARAVKEYTRDAMKAFQDSFPAAHAHASPEKLKERLAAVMQLGADFTWLKKYMQHSVTSQEIMNVYQIDKSIEFLQQTKKDTQAELLKAILGKGSEKLRRGSASPREIVTAARGSIARLNLERTSDLYADAVKGYNDLEGKGQARHGLRQFYENDERIQGERLHRTTKLNKRMQALESTIHALKSKMDGDALTTLLALQSKLLEDRRIEERELEAALTKSYATRKLDLPSLVQEARKAYTSFGAYVTPEGNTSRRFWTGLDEGFKEMLALRASRLDLSSKLHQLTDLQKRISRLRELPQVSGLPRSNVLQQFEQSILTEKTNYERTDVV